MNVPAVGCPCLIPVRLSERQSNPENRSGVRRRKEARKGNAERSLGRIRACVIKSLAILFGSL